MSDVTGFWEHQLPITLPQKKNHVATTQVLTMNPHYSFKLWATSWH